MAIKSFNLHFYGYYLKSQINTHISTGPGIYCIHNCIPYRTTNKLRDLRLLYIGEAENLRDRVTEQSNSQKFINYVGNGRKLCFNYAILKSRVSESHRKLIEHAMIFCNQPVVNRKGKKSPPDKYITVKSTGKRHEIKKEISVGPDGEL